MKTAAFDRVKVADFSWVIVGPLITKFLADYGATVVRVESLERPDPERTSAPFKDGIAGMNRSGYFAQFNTNKLSMALNLNHPAGREVAKELIAWADIVVENFTPGVMDRWGLGYHQLAKINPKVIMLSSSNYGQTGPFSVMAGYGFHTTSLAGFTHFTGWPNQDYAQPIGPGPYCDITTPYFGVVALIAALVYRNKTGKGQYIDLSQYESSLHFLSTAMLDFELNGVVGGRKGNKSDYAVPHGVYRCKGHDRWCALAVCSERHWSALCEASCNTRWSKDSRFASLAKRKEHEDELDRLIEGWTLSHTAEEVFSILNSLGIPCGIVQTASDLLTDPQLKHRHFFWEVEHPEMGRFHCLGYPSTLSKAPSQLHRPPPCIGEHTEQVCREFLGMSQEKFVQLFNDDVFH